MGIHVRTVGESVELGEGEKVMKLLQTVFMFFVCSPAEFRHYLWQGRELRRLEKLYATRDGHLGRKAE